MEYPMGWYWYGMGRENEKNHTTIGSALLGIEPNIDYITSPRTGGYRLMQMVWDYVRTKW